ncbi:hypothetical protein [Geothrix edaphica]|uniref:Uncharacterized protein n=1 Tax=Geothrix edaphica TaxID=2927976 RepID=A0ABQ5PU03_9BACT|nr:hypothetical protein [Geothrix edaphica]GLH65852.1 hypothetical protein GETHED_02160 [Geothrix edaphica]
MQTLALAALLCLAQTPTPAPAPTAPVQAPAAAPAAETSLSYYSESFPFAWDRTIPLTVNLDGLKVTSIFFNRRVIEPGFFNLLKGAEFGTRAQVEVTNTAKYPKIPGFAVAVLDRDGRLLGVASGGTKVGTIKPGETEAFDLNFTQVKERLAKGDRFVLAIELRN